MIKMNKKFDMKISPYFTGTIHYKKEDYITEKIIYVDLHFKQGKITKVLLYDDPENPFTAKRGNPQRWNSNFWKKAPLYVNHDSCSYKRLHVYTDNFSFEHIDNQLVKLYKSMIPVVLA